MVLGTNRNKFPNAEYQDVLRMPKFLKKGQLVYFRAECPNWKMTVLKKKSWGLWCGVKKLAMIGEETGKIIYEMMYPSQPNSYLFL